LNQLGLHLQKETYVPVTCESSTAGCPQGWATHNPLLLDPVRNQYLLLDRPHYSGAVPVGDVCRDQIYTPELRQYGKNYTNYGDITGGQIQYYTTDDLAAAYYSPNFVTPSTVVHKVIQDPMTNPRAQYDRYENIPYSWDRCRPLTCDSFTHDTLEFRQSLMATQMRKRNEQRWQSRWAVAS
jgi:hypothetical protein